MSLAQTGFIMRAIRIYQPGFYQIADAVALSAEASQHVGTVLRMQPGAAITLFNGEGWEALAKITEVRKKQVVVVIDAASRRSCESPKAIHLAQAISKGDKMEWVVQKAVELGVASITPLITERCAVKLDTERMSKKVHQWQAIAISACEQCGRTVVPVVQMPLKWEAFLKQPITGQGYILNPEGGSSWRDYAFDTTDLSLVIGPEGGLSPDEIRQAQDAGFRPLTLGPRVLRTETAAITALSVLQAVAGDL